MLRLSIVIPVLGDPQQLDDTLVSVLENRPANCEIVVVHNRPYHDPYRLSDEVRFIEAERGTALAECLNRGLAASRASVVHVLTCGVEVSAGWADVAFRRFGDPDVAAVGSVVLNRDDPEKAISAGASTLPQAPASVGLLRSAFAASSSITRTACTPTDASISHPPAESR